MTDIGSSESRPLARGGRPSNPYKRDPLPPAARAKLVSLREQADDFSLSHRAASDRLTEARVAKQNAESRLRELLDPRWHVPSAPNHDRFIDTTLGRPGNNFGSASLPMPATIDPAEVERVRLEIANSTAEIARLQGVVAERSAALKPLAQTVGAIDRYLEDLPANVTLAEHNGKPPKLGKGVVLADELERTRNEILELKADRHQVASAPRPSAEAKSAARAYVLELAAKAPRSDYFLDGLTTVEWPMVYSNQIVEGLPDGRVATVSFETIDVAAVLAWMHKDAMIAAFNKDIAEMADDEHALTAAERTKREREIAAQILACERTEEVICVETGAPRRPDCDPRAVLNLADNSPAPTE